MLVFLDGEKKLHKVFEPEPYLLSFLPIYCHQQGHKVPYCTMKLGKNFLGKTSGEVDMCGIHLHYMLGTSVLTLSRIWSQICIGDDVCV